MFCIVDTKQSMAMIKSGFKTGSQANDWAKKNLPKDEVKLWKPGIKNDHWFGFRYFVRMR